MKIYACLIGLFLCSISLTGQGVYLAGEITTNEGERISGYIKNAPYPVLSEAISFKTSRKGPVQSLNPSTILGFSFADGDRFFSRASDYAPDGIAQKRFFHLLSDGAVKLLELPGKQLSPLFIQQGDGPIQLLCMGEGSTLDYRAVLASALGLDPAENSLEALPLKRKPIQKLITAYHLGKPLPRFKKSKDHLPSTGLWTYGGIQVKANLDEFKGWTRGFMGEQAFGKSRQWSVSGGLGIYTGDKWITRIHPNSQIYVKISSMDWLLRGNFYAWRKGGISPYFFAGARYSNTTEERKTFRSFISEIRQTEETTIQQKISPHLGGGLAVFLKRHQLRLELADFKEQFSIKLGYGFTFGKVP